MVKQLVNSINLMIAALLINMSVTDDDGVDASQDSEEIARVLNNLLMGEKKAGETLFNNSIFGEKLVETLHIGEGEATPAPVFAMVGANGAGGDTVAEEITHREKEVLSYVSLGYGNKQIADQLSISEQTIKNHMSSILQKMNANDRTHAVVLALRRGWIKV